MENESETQDESEDERMFAALSFVIILIVIGLPLWWKVTKVERSFFPYEDISELKNKNVLFHFNLTVTSSNQEEAESIAKNLQTLFLNSKLFKPRLSTSLISASIAEKPLLELENSAQLHSNKSGIIQLIEVRNLHHNAIIGKYRTVYYKKGIDAAQIYAFLQETLLHEKVLLEAVNAVMSPGYTSDNLNYLRKMRPSPQYDIIFTVVDPEPKKVKFIWDSEFIIQQYFNPLIKQLDSLSKFHIKSQWLYFIELHQKPKAVNDRYELNEQQIPHIITPLEKKIGSGVAKNPCINFVLYINKCEHNHTIFVKGKRSSKAVLSARWGGIQLIDPARSYCEGLKSMQINPRPVMETFIKQFKTLIGLIDVTDLVIHNSNNMTIYTWEMDILYRVRILELFILSKLTLTSLSQLLGEINNIVITEEVGNSVLKSVQYAEYTLKSLSYGNLEEAINYSREAFISSEFAFTHPSLLALLYFPDDQKYAVYIPLYLPIMIPVLLSLKNIYPWLMKKIFAKTDVEKKIL